MEHQHASDGVDLTLALLYQDRYEDVIAFAPDVERLQPTGRLAVQLQWTQGAALARVNQPERARMHLKRALAPPSASTELASATAPQAQTSLRARAALELAGVEWREGQLRAAHEYQQLATALAAEAGDLAMATYTRLGLVDILILQGDFTSAERELTELARAAEAQPDRAVFLLKLGIAYNDLGNEALAHEPLTTALAAERASKTPRSSVLVALLLNLSWVERKSGDSAKALEYVEAAAELGAAAMDLRLNRGLAMRDAGRLAEAKAELVAARAAGPTGEWIWWLHFNQGEVDARLGDPAGAEHQLRAAVAAIERQRTAATPTAPAVHVRQREAYTALIGLLAQQGRWLDVLDVLQRLDEGAMSQLLVAPSSLVHGSAAGGADEAASSPAAPSFRRASPAEVLEAWRSRWLVMLVRGGARMWRIQLRAGEVTGDDVGEAEALEQAAATLERDPKRDEAALLLGEALLLPPQHAGKSPTVPSAPTTPPPPTTRAPAPPPPVDVFLVGQIGRAPLSLLRHRDGLLRDRFSLGRVLQISPRRASSPRLGGAVVLGDPRSDLRQARLEAQHVAELLGVAPRLGEAASSEALEDARAAALLHIAAHTKMIEGRPSLQLADRAVPLTEIRALTPAPQLVVLGTCGSASERDQSLWGSLASAFLDAGSDAVIATSKSVPDEEARQVIEELYRRGGLAGVSRDPARALADAQRALRDQVPPEILSAFLVLRAPPELRAIRAP